MDSSTGIFLVLSFGSRSSSLAWKPPRSGRPGPCHRDTVVQKRTKRLFCSLTSSRQVGVATCRLLSPGQSCPLDLLQVGDTVTEEMDLAWRVAQGTGEALHAREGRRRRSRLDDMTDMTGNCSGLQVKGCQVCSSTTRSGSGTTCTRASS